MDDRKTRTGLEDWAMGAGLLPVGWQEQARGLGALRRARGIPHAEVLLRAWLVHVAEGCSLTETSLGVGEAGWCRLSSAALFKRLQGAEDGWRWLAEAMWP